MSRARLAVTTILRFLLCLWLSAYLWAATDDDSTGDLEPVSDDEPLEPANALCNGVTIDLRHPTLSGGVLTTEEGGVITGPNIRIQGRHVVATRSVVDGKDQYRITADGDLMLEYDDTVFTGQALEYDFSTRYGRITDGHSAVEPWYFSAGEVEILPDGHYLLHDAYVTTSPSLLPDWNVRACEADLAPDKTLYARQVTLHLGQLPVFWLPTFKTNLDDLSDSPIRYRVRWGGKQGPRFGISYRIWESECFESTLRLDYRLSRGPGAALETEYSNPSSGALFATRNYAARDSSISEPNERFRYRLQGLYTQCFWQNSLSLHATYDKVSDMDMPTDYAERDLEIKTSGLTQLRLRGQHPICIANLLTRIRANSFETIKEEIPTISANFHPFVLGPTGIISENYIKAGYFDFLYSDQQPSVPNFNSTRIECRHALYRPFQMPFLNFTPDAGIVAIYYGNDPAHKPTWLVVGEFGAEVNTHFYRLYGWRRHVVEPYARYQFLTLPNTDPSDRFVFDIHDGWYHVNALRFGMRNLFYQKPWAEDCPARLLSTDLYTYAFINTNKVEQVIPRLFGDLRWDLTQRLRITVNSAWDLERRQIAFFNNRIEWTWNDWMAVAAEYRHRNDFWWRKADPQNLMLDFFHSEAELRRSQLSDRRDTILLHAYWRLQHNLAVEARIQRGWNRINEPNYNEYQFDLLKTVRSSWLVKLSYQNTQDDHRVAFYVSFGIKKPKDSWCDRYWTSYQDE